MAEPTLPELSLSDGDLFGAALTGPSLTADLSTWNLTVHKHGVLSQTVNLAQPPTFNGQIATLRQHVDAAQMQALKDLVAKIRFFELDPYYQADMKDQDHTTLIVRLFGKTKVVNMYGPHVLAWGGNDAGERYAQLWDAIVCLSPFQPYRY